MGRPYYLKRGSDVYGPFTSRKLYDEAQAGGLKTTDLISRSKTGPWTEAHSIKGLAFPNERENAMPVAVAVPVSTFKMSTDETEARWAGDEANPYKGPAQNVEINPKQLKEEGLGERELSKSLKVLVFFMVLGGLRLLVAGIGNLAVEAAHVAFLQLFVLLPLHCYVLWGIVNLRKKAVVLWYCCLPIGLVIHVLVSIHNVEAANAFNRFINSPTREYFSMVDVSAGVFLQLISAALFTAFIWPNRKLFSPPLWKK